MLHYCFVYAGLLFTKVYWFYLFNIYRRSQLLLYWMLCKIKFLYLSLYPSHLLKFFLNLIVKKVSNIHTVLKNRFCLYMYNCKQIKCKYWYIVRKFWKARKLSNENYTCPISDREHDCGSQTNKKVN